MRDKWKVHSDTTGWIVAILLMIAVLVFGPIIAWDADQRYNVLQEQLRSVEGDFQEYKATSVNQTREAEAKADRDAARAANLIICTQDNLEKDHKIAKERVLGEHLLAKERALTLEWQEWAKFRYDLYYYTNWEFAWDIMVEEYGEQVQVYLEAGGSCQPPKDTSLETPVVSVLRERESAPWN